MQRLIGTPIGEVAITAQGGAVRRIAFVYGAECRGNLPDPEEIMRRRTAADSADESGTAASDPGVIMRRRTAAADSADESGEGAFDGRDEQLLDRTERQLGEYFAGKRKAFDLPIAFPKASEFRTRVWQYLSTIPYGETRTYAQAAESAGLASAMRAAGGVVGANPLAIVVPCHRIIGAHGSLTGFGGGLERKIFLLRLEGVLL